MKRLPTSESFNWLKAVTCEHEEDVGHRVKCWLPGTFESYAKIFNHMLEDFSIDGDEITWAESQAADDPVLATSDKAVPLEESGDLRRIRWSEMCERYSVEYNVELAVEAFTRAFAGNRSWPRRFYSPHPGSLDAEDAEALIEILSQLSPDESCFFHYCFLATLEEDDTYSGQLTDALKQEFSPYTPTYWWSSSHEWAVYTDWDLTYTFVGGSKHLIDSILATPTLEALEVSPDTRIIEFLPPGSPLIQ